MKNGLLVILCLCLCLTVKAGGKDTTINYSLPDTVTAIQFMAEIKIQGMNNPKRFIAGIQTNMGSLYFADHRGKRSVTFQVHEHSRVVALAMGTTNSKFGLDYFNYAWKEGITYKLMVAMAADSASQTSLYSAYIFLPEENKWKLLGSRRHPFYRYKLFEPSIFLKAHKKSEGQLIIGDVWCQRSNGSWRNMKDGNPPPPVINYFGHIDSVAQRQIDIKMITDSIAAGKTDATKNIDGVYYAILKEGTGKQVSVNDTVVAHYKGYLFADGKVFDQTADKPATFPLKRLIKAWQIGVPLLKVGGKIKLVIPSDMAYSIRTRAAKIPPNSILVFEIEVIEARSPQ
jgi:FKBP-type peptidyl-prolyl cis-trans isomerase FkpA